MKSIRCLFSLVLFSGLLLGAMALVACGSSNPHSDNSKSDTILYVQSIVGEEGGTIFSDVVTKGGFVCNDNAEVTLVAELKGQSSSSSFFNNVLITSYRIEYIRADGNNAPGVDVPFAVEGFISYEVPINGIAIFPLVVVRHLAKLESPLLELRGGGIVATSARITFYGEDIAGDAISTTGFVEIHFTNFGDEDEDTCPT